MASRFWQSPDTAGHTTAASGACGLQAHIVFAVRPVQTDPTSGCPLFRRKSPAQRLRCWVPSSLRSSAAGEGGRLRNELIAHPIRFPSCVRRVANSVWSAAHGIYPGLANLISSSQWIMVVSIQSGPASPRPHSYSSRAVQKVRVLYVLKGDLATQNEPDVALDSEILFPTRTYLEAGDYPVL